jgi:hypothetical protein
MLGGANPPVLSRLDGLEEVDSVSIGCLSLHPGVPENRNLRLDLPIATRSGVHTQQHSRRTSEAINRRVQAISGNARGLLAEVETQLLIARELGYLENQVSKELLDATAEIGRMLNGLLAALKQ